MKCILITPAWNEESFIEWTMKSVIAQTVRPTRWVIVNDGSTDATPDLIDQYAHEHDWIKRLDMPAHRQRNFAEKARCFNKGYESIRQLDFDVVGNVDADLSFDPDHLEFLLKQFVERPDLGVAGTVFREKGGYDSGRDSFEGENHVAGGCQLFRRTCFEQVGGYVANPAGGVDWIAVTTARMKGWQTQSFRQKHFFHHRALGTAERSKFAAGFSYGEKDYYLGNHPLWELLRIGYRFWKSPSGSLALACGFAWAAVRRIPRPVSAALMRFHRHEQMTKLRAIVLAVLRLQKVDNFHLMSRDRRSEAAKTN